MANYHDLLARYVARCKGETDRQYLTNPRMPIYGERVCSFGSHFELARPIRKRNGAIDFWLLNGDRYSPTTTQHQGAVRRALADERTVIIPHEALEAAGILLDSIQLIDASGEVTESIQHRSHKEPEGRWRIEDEWDYRQRTDEELKERLDRKWMQLKWHDKEAPYPEPSQHDREIYAPTGEKKHTLIVARSPVKISETDGEWSYEWTTYRHHLGESVIRAKVAWNNSKGQRSRWAYFLSGFDAQDNETYFFCELPPKVKPTSVESAYELLKPPVVQTAELWGRDIRRQGDIFAVPMEVDKRALRKMGADFAKMGQLIGTNHFATETARIAGQTFARGVLWHRPEGRPPDHRRQRMASGWNLIAKNTVPTTTRSTR